MSDERKQRVHSYPEDAHAAVPIPDGLRYGWFPARFVDLR